MNTEKMTEFFSAYWEIPSLLFGAVILVGTATILSRFLLPKCLCLCYTEFLFAVNPAKNNKTGH